MTPTSPIHLVIGRSYTKELRQRLREYGITQNELARETGIDKTAISRWMNKDVQPRLTSIAQLEEGIVKILKRRARAIEKHSRG